MAITRCKFRCDVVSKQKSWDPKHEFLYSVTMGPVYGNGDPNHENSKFWSASPAGKFELTCIHADLFEVGQEYYLDITPAG